MFRLFFLATFAATAALFFAACSPTPDPRTAPVSAATSDDFAAWKNAAYEKFSPDERNEFDYCINQIRLRISMNNEASGDAAIAQALCERVNGKTMREIMIMAYTSEGEWVAKELARQSDALARADAILDGPGSDDSKVNTRALRVALANIVSNLEKRQAKAQARLKELQDEK